MAKTLLHIRISLKHVQHTWKVKVKNCSMPDSLKHMQHTWMCRKFYVGRCKTGRLTARLEEHKRGEASEWTRMWVGFNLSMHACTAGWTQDSDWLVNWLIGCTARWTQDTSWVCAAHWNNARWSDRPGIRERFRAAHPQVQATFAA